MRKHKNFWDKNAGRYDRFMRKDRAAYDEMYVLIRLVVKAKTVLELATGTGLIAKHIVNAAAHIEATDRAIGRLVAGLPEDVIVVFTSAHGDMHGAHGLFRKGWPHEESVRVPLLVRGAPGGGAGVRCDAPVSLLDLRAMTLAWADGRAWTCARERAEISMPSVVALPHQCDRRWRGWRSPSRKEIFNDDGSPWLAFDLAADPGELRNLA